MPAIITSETLKEQDKTNTGANNRLNILLHFLYLLVLFQIDLFFNLFSLLNLYSPFNMNVIAVT